MTQNVGGIDRILRIIVGVALLVWGFVLNAEPVPLNYYFGSRDIPLSMVVFFVIPETYQNGQHQS